MFKYKIDVLLELRKAGFNVQRLRNENIFGQSSLTKIRRGVVVGVNDLDKLCTLLKLQPGDIVEHIPGGETIPRPAESDAPKE